jgi:hypothetical protein
MTVIVTTQGDKTSAMTRLGGAGAEMLLLSLPRDPAAEKSTLDLSDKQRTPPTGNLTTPTPPAGSSADLQV